MAGIVPICSYTWIPEDDVLLKNAIEVITQFYRSSVPIYTLHFGLLFTLIISQLLMFALAIRFICCTIFQ